MCGSGAIVWPSVGIVLASAVTWLLTNVGAIFVRNSQFHIRVSIWCQFRDSVTGALGKGLPSNESVFICPNWAKYELRLTVSDGY